MLEPIIAVLSERIIATTLIERHGGLVRTARKITIVEGQPFEELYPVAMDVTDKECWEKGKYLDLAPNSSKKSISYFEQNGPVKVDGYDNRLTFEANVSFVCWLNMKRLGETAQNGHLWEKAMVKKLSERLVVPQHNKLTCSIASLSPKNEGIFHKYNYGDRLDLFLYPYDFFSIQLLIKWEMDTNCFPDLETKDKIC